MLKMFSSIVIYMIRASIEGDLVATMARVLNDVDFQHYVESKDMAYMVMKVEWPGIEQGPVLYT